MKWLVSTPCGCLGVLDDGTVQEVLVFAAEADDTELLGAETDDVILAP